MLEVLGAPEHETENVAALAIPIEANKREAAMLLAANNFIFMRITLLNLITKTDDNGTSRALMPTPIIDALEDKSLHKRGYLGIGSIDR